MIAHVLLSLLIPVFNFCIQAENAAIGEGKVVQYVFCLEAYRDYPEKINEKIRSRSKIVISLQIVAL